MSRARHGEPYYAVIAHPNFQPSQATDMIPDASHLSYKTYFPATSQPVVTGTLTVYQVRLANQSYQTPISGSNSPNLKDVYVSFAP